MRVKEENEKAGLKLNMWSHHYLANRRGKMKSMTDFVFLFSKTTVDNDCSHENKRRLLLGRKAMTNLDTILKSKVITLPTKIRVVKAMVFPGVMCGCVSWPLKK